MTSYQHFALVELSLLLYACGILILIFSHYSMKKRYALINQTTIATTNLSWSVFFRLLSATLDYVYYSLYCAALSHHLAYI
jgi:hypothetical protein